MSLNKISSPEELLDGLVKRLSTPNTNQQSITKALLTLADIMEPEVFYKNFVIAMKDKNRKKKIQAMAMELSAIFFSIQAGWSLPKNDRNIISSHRDRRESGVYQLLEDCFELPSILKFLNEVKDWENRFNNPQKSDYSVFLQNKLAVLDRVPIADITEIFSVVSANCKYKLSFFDVGNNSVGTISAVCVSEFIEHFNELTKKVRLPLAFVHIVNDFWKLGPDRYTIELFLVDEASRIIKKNGNHKIQRMPSAAALLYFISKQAIENKATKGCLEITAISALHKSFRSQAPTQSIYDKMPSALNEAIRALTTGSVGINDLGIQSNKGEKKRPSHREDAEELNFRQPYDLQWSVCIIEEVSA